MLSESKSHPNTVIELVYDLAHCATDPKRGMLWGLDLSAHEKLFLAYMAICLPERGDHLWRYDTELAGFLALSVRKVRQIESSLIARGLIRVVEGVIHE